jgi:hypothetical protein
MFSAFVDQAKWHMAMQDALRRGFPQVIANTLTQAARIADKAQRENLRKDFTLRNQYTEGSLFMWPASPTHAISRMNAVVGTKSPYLPIQETGGTERAKGKSLAMPTVAGRGGDVKKAIPTPLTLRAMGQIGGTSQKFTKKGNARRGKGFFILPAGPALKHPAIFLRQGNQLLKLRLLGKKTQQVRARHWHTDAVKKITYRELNEIFTRVGSIVMRIGR